MCITERSMPGSRPGGRLVEEEQRRLGQQLQGHADPLALAAGEAVDGLPGALLQAQLADHLVDPFPALGLGGVLREAQLGGVGEGAADGQLGVQDVVLRDQADALAQLGVVAVEVAAVVQDCARVGGALPGQGVQQGRLACAAGADHGEEAFLADGKGDLVEQRLAAPVDGDGEFLDIEGDLAGVDVLLQLVADQAERGVADADDVTGRDRGPVDGLPVEERAVVAAEVDDLVRAVRAGPQLRVVPGDGQVVDDQVVVAGPGRCGRSGRAAGARRSAAGRCCVEAGPGTPERRSAGAGPVTTARGPSEGLPKRMTLPGPTSHSWTRWPSAYVPLVLFSSSSIQWPASARSTAWCHETRSSSRTMSLSGSRPT